MAGSTKRILSGVGTVIITVVATLISDWIKGDSAFSLFKNILAWIYDKMFISVPLWSLLVVSIVSVLSCYATIRTKRHNRENLRKWTPPPVPDFIKYTTKIYDGILWEWQWERYNGSWRINDLHPCCPKDGTRLTMDFQCPRCDKYYFNVQRCSMEKLCLLIEDDVKKGIYPNTRISN